MRMTSEEIVRDYNQAKNKQKQIKILADLNQVYPSDIRAVLFEAGVEGVKAPKRKPRWAPETPQDTDADIYDRIETVLAALLARPQSLAIRVIARDLACAMFTDYLSRRLELEEEGCDTE